MASIEQLQSEQNMQSNRASQTTQTKTERTFRSEETERVTRSQENTPDAFSLSEESRAINEMNQQMVNESQFDSAKVEAIKEAIAKGTYRVDADKLASNIMRHRDELQDLN